MEGCNTFLFQSAAAYTQVNGNIQGMQSKQRYIMVYWQESEQAIFNLVHF
jgi:hypothetical protein